jgi:hypothetical protein
MTVKVGVSGQQAEQPPAELDQERMVDFAGLTRIDEGMHSNAQRPPSRSSSRFWPDGPIPATMSIWPCI